MALTNGSIIYLSEPKVGRRHNMILFNQSGLDEFLPWKASDK